MIHAYSCSSSTVINFECEICYLHYAILTKINGTYAHFLLLLTFALPPLYPNQVKLYYMCTQYNFIQCQRFMMLRGTKKTKTNNNRNNKAETLFLYCFLSLCMCSFICGLMILIKKFIKRVSNKTFQIYIHNCKKTKIKH